MTQITDEMKVAAVKAYTEVDGKCRPAAMQKALEAALPFLPIAVEEKVKALDWEGSGTWNVAATVVGRYVVRPCLATKYDGQWLMRRPEKETSDLYPSEAEAKRAAQAAYETRILSALISSPGKDGGQEVEAVGNEAAELARLRAIALDMQAGYVEATERAEEAVKAANALQAEVDRLRDTRPQPASTAQEVEAVACAARKQGTAGGNDPADCDWPFCGCDPHADQVIAAIEESGRLDAQPASTALVEAASFLAHRLDDFRQKIDDFDDEREFVGKIVPALDLLRSALSASQSTSREAETKS